MSILTLYLQIKDMLPGLISLNTYKIITVRDSQSVFFSTLIFASMHVHKVDNTYRLLILHQITSITQPTQINWHLILKMGSSHSG